MKAKRILALLLCLVVLWSQFTGVDNDTGIWPRGHYFRKPG